MPLSLPALLRAGKLLRRARRAGLATTDAATAASEVGRALDALRHEGSRSGLGNLLLSAVRLGQSLGIEPEEALRDAVAAFERDLRRGEANG